MAKKTRIPELVVGKIYIDDGRGNNVYTLDVDNNNGGALRIGDNKNGSVATINQNTGEISATKIRGSSLHGDGSEIEGLTQQELQEIESAKLVTISSDRLFFVFKENGLPYNSGEKATITANVQNIDDPIVWSAADGFTAYTTVGNELEIQASALNSLNSVTITATAGNLSDSTTIGKVTNGATGKSAVTILMPNDTVNFQSSADGSLVDLSAGKSDIVVLYGSDQLVPTAETPASGEFKVTVAPGAGDENITVGSIENKSFKVTVGDTTNHSSMVADSASITYTIEVKTTDGDAHTFEKVQTFTKSKDGWDGSAGKTLKLTADDYQVAYNQMGESPDPQVINVTATPGGTSETLEYKFYLNDEVIQVKDENDQLQDWTTSNTRQLTSPVSHAAFNKMIVKVEATTNSTEDPAEIYAHDSISVIGTKDGENVVRISADNPSHSFTVDAGGTISNDDYDVGAINFNLYFGNTELSPNVSAVFDPEDSEEELLDSFNQTNSAGLGVNQFAVNANASNSTVAPNTQTIDFGLDTNGNILKSTPSNFGTDETSAAIVFIFYARVSADLILGPYTLTQTFSKSREGQQGIQGLKGDGAKAVKLLADDYQVAYNAAGKAPDPQVVNLSVETQNITSTQTIQYRFTVDGNSSALQNSGDNPYGTFSIDVSDDSYDDFGKKKKIKVEVFEGNGASPVAEDSISIIATKEGSNAVEIVADNLSHQFTANTLGDLDDPSSGDNIFEVYIGNTQLTALLSTADAQWTDALAKNVFTATATYSGVHGVTSNTAFSTANVTVTDENGTSTSQPLKLVHSMAGASMPQDAGNVEFKIYVKDGDGEERGPYTKKQTITRSKESLSAKSLILGADSYIFPFDEVGSTVPKSGRGTIIVSINQQNLGGEYKTIQVKDKNNNILENLGSPTLAGTVDANGTGTQTFEINYSDIDSDSSVAKSKLPLKVICMCSGIQDTIQLHAIEGGSNTVKEIIPNDNHTFTAEQNGTVEAEYIAPGGSDILVYEGAELISYDSSLVWNDSNGNAIELNTEQVGAPSWNFKSITSETGMVSLSATAQGNLQVDNVLATKDSDKVVVEIFVRRSTGEGVTLTRNLSYSKAKKGSDGKDILSVNGDFNQGPVGWAAGDASSMSPDTMNDFPAEVFSVSEDPRAKHGPSIGVFKTTGGTPLTIWNSESVNIGESGSWKHTLRLRAFPGNPGFAWVIRLYTSSADAVDDPNYDPDEQIEYTVQDVYIHKKSKRDPLELECSDYTLYSPVSSGALDTSLSDAIDYDGLSGITFTTHVARFTPEQLDSMVPHASKFRIGIVYLPAGTGDSDLLVDCFKAEYAMVGNLVELDPDRAGALEGVESSTEDLKDRWGHLAEEVSEQNPEALFNGKLNLISQVDELPQGIVVFNNTDSNATEGPPKPLRDSTSGLTKWSSGANPEWMLQPESGVWKKGILFKAVKIPSPEHTMKISVTYYATTAADANQHPAFLRVYFKKDLPAGRKYINTGSTLVNGDKLSKQSDTSSGTGSEVITEFVSPTIFVNADSNGSFHLDSATEETKVFRVTFDDNSYLNTLVAGEEPTHASIALFTGWGDDPANASSLVIKEVALEWTLFTDNIVSKSIAGTLVNSSIINMSDNIVANGVAASDANAEAVSASTAAGVASQAAATAQSAAATADSKAVTAQSAAATADSKAVTAQTTADTANSTANTVNGRFGGPGNRLTNTYATNNPPESVGYSQAPPTSPQTGDMVHIEGDDETPGGLWRYTGIGTGDPWTSATQTVAGVDIQWYDFQLGQENFESTLWTARGTGAPESTEKWPETADMIFEQGTGGVIRYTNSFYGTGNVNRFNKTGLVVREGAGGVFTFRQPFYGNVRLHIEYMTTAKSGNTYSRDSTPASDPYMYVHTKTNDTNWAFNSSYKWYSQGSQVSDQLAGPEGHEYSYSSGVWPNQKTKYVRHARMFIEKTGKWYLKVGALDTHNNHRPIIHRIGIEGWVPAKDFDTQAKVFELGSNASYNFLSFTGQHKCAPANPEEQVQTGMIVSSTGQYDNFNYEKEEENSRRHKVNPKEAVPIVEVSKVEKDKKVVGVYAGEWERSKFKNKSFAVAGTDDALITRYEINSLGEGGIWVSDAAGFLENGDYICSANIPGYGMKQDDDILRNYTVAKITQDCYFDLESEDYDCKEIEHDGETYKIAFVGCTYHCG